MSVELSELSLLLRKSREVIAVSGLDLPDRTAELLQELIAYLVRCEVARPVVRPYPSVDELSSFSTYEFAAYDQDDLNMFHAVIVSLFKQLGVETLAEARDKIDELLNYESRFRGMRRR